MDLAYNPQIVRPRGWRGFVRRTAPAVGAKNYSEVDARTQLRRLAMLGTLAYDLARRMTSDFPSRKPMPQTRFSRLLTLIACLAACGFASAVRADTSTLFDPARHMRVSEVKPGMTGYGLSVFKGTKIER